MNKLPLKAKGERPYYLSDRATEINVGVTLALAAEVSVLREQVELLVRLLDETGGLREKMRAYQPDAKLDAELEAERLAFLDRVLRAVKSEVETLNEHAEGKSFQSVMESVLVD